MKRYLLFLLCLIAFGAHAENKYYAFQGTLGDNISFRLDLEEEEYSRVVIGETTYYRKDGKVSKIKVYGFASDQELTQETFHTLTLTEFLGTKVCGNWTVALTMDGMFAGGVWTLGDKLYKTSDVEDLPTDDPITFVHPVEISDATGEYEFTRDSFVDDEMPEYGGKVQLYTKHGYLAYTISQATPNIAAVQNTVAEYGDMSFYIACTDMTYAVRTYEDAVIVMHVNPTDGPSEDFGWGADIAGIYIATGEQPTGDILNFFAKEEEFGETISCSLFDLYGAWQYAVAGETTYPDELILRDIDGDGRNEIIARYIPDRTEWYEVAGERTAVFVVDEDGPLCVCSATGKLESIDIADGYVIKNVSNARGTRTTHYYTKIENSEIALNARFIETEINSFTIEGNTVPEKSFKKIIKPKKRIPAATLDGWITIPGSENRNENAIRG